MAAVCSTGTAVADTDAVAVASALTAVSSCTRTFLRVSRRLRRSLGTAGVLSSASTLFGLLRG